MQSQSTEKRLSALETAQRPAPDGRTFMCDIGTDPPRHWIDGTEVDAALWRAWVPPRGPYVVDVSGYA